MKRYVTSQAPRKASDLPLSGFGLSAVEFHEGAISAEDSADLPVAFSEKPTPAATNHSLPPKPTGAPAEIPLGMPKVSLRANWKLGHGKLPHFLVRGRGQQLEEIIAHFTAALSRERRPTVSLAWAGEQSNVPDVNRPLRVVNTLAPGHVSATDVVAHAEGSDLYLRFECLPYTWIMYLRYLLHAAFFFTAFFLMLGLYLYALGGFKNWAIDFAKQHARHDFKGFDKDTFYANIIFQGCDRTDWEQFLAVLESNNAKKDIDRLIAMALKDLQENAKAVKGNAINEDFLGLMGGFGILLQMKNSGEYFFVSIGIAHLNKCNSDSYMIWENRNSPWNPLRHPGSGYPAKESQQLVNVDLNTVYSLDDLKSEFPKLVKTVNEAYRQSTRHESPWSVWRLFWADASLAIRTLGLPAGLIAGAIGCLLWFAPPNWLRHPCRWLGWPTPDEFINAAQGHTAWTQRVLSDTLLYEFGVQQKDIIDIGK